jgi:phytoene dehydrogenase-like protein
VIVVGAGHNGLVAAAYLARAGLRTLVLERRPIVGGACVTEELWPGYRISRGAYVAGLLRPVVVRELGLEARGLRLIARDPSSFTPLRDGRSLLLGRDLEAACGEIRRFSPRDARLYPCYERFLDGVARSLEPLLDSAPPDLRRPRLEELWPALRAGGRLLRLGRRLPDAASLLLGPARPVLESWFESEPLRSTLATDALIGAWASPSTPGTGYVLFHHVMGETHGARGVWAYVSGGMGALSEAVARAARDAGAEIRLETPVRRILCHAGSVRGVELESGEVIDASIVLSNADPLRTCALVDREQLPDDFVRRVEAIDFRSPVLKMNLALDRLPRFPSRPADGVCPAHRATIHVGAASLDELEASFGAAAGGRLPERPMVELTLPSSVDPALAPPGRHVASLFVQHVPWCPPGGWEGARESFADRVLAIVDEVAPGFSASVLRREVLAPPDLERLFGLTGGNIFHGAMSPDRLFALRPVAGWSRHRAPVRGLLLCGAGAHPGGGVMGACGRNAARVTIRDAARLLA